MNSLQPLSRSTLPAARTGAASSGPARPPLDDETVVSLMDVAGALRRRWRTVAVCLAAGVAAGLLYGTRLSPKYEASAMLRIQEKPTGVPGTYPTSPNPDAVLTEMDVLHARALAAETVDSLGLRLQVVAPRNGSPIALFSHVQVAPAADSGTYRLTWTGQGTVAVTRAATGARVATLQTGQPGDFAGAHVAAVPNAAPATVVDVRVLPRNAAIDATWRDVSVARTGPQSDAVKLWLRDADTLKARAVLDTWIGSYLTRRQLAQHTEARSTARFLRAQIDTLTGQLATAERTFTDFRERERVVSPDAEASTQVGRLAQLQADRAVADGERRALSTLVDDVRGSASAATTGATAPAASPYRRLLGFPSLLRNQSASQLLATLNEIENQRAALLTRRLPNDPDVKVLSDRVAQVETQIQDLATTYLAGLTAQVQADDHELAQFGAQLAQVPTRQIEYARLQRQPQVLSQLVTTLQTRLKEAEIAQAVEDPTVQVIDQPYVSSRPVGPTKQLALAGGVFLGLVVGAVLVLVKERVDQAVRTRSDVAWAIGGPVVGSVPTLTTAGMGAPWRRFGRSVSAGDRARAARSAQGLVASVQPTGDRTEGAVIAADGTRRYLLPVGAEEAYTRVILNAVAERLNGGSGPISLLITSPHAGDGKTTSAVNIATTLARRGVRTVLVDADIRRGGIDAVFDVPRSPGLSDLLSDRTALADVVRRVSVAEGRDLSFVTMGTPSSDAPALFASPQMRATHAALRESFDVIVFDTPPAALVSDAVDLAFGVDGVLLVARANATSRDSITYVAEEFRRVNVPLLGAILNDVDPRQLDEYDARSYRAYTQSVA